MSQLSTSPTKWNDPGRNSTEYRAAVNTLLEAYQPDVTPITSQHHQNGIICTPSSINTPMRFLSASVTPQLSTNSAPTSSAPSIKSSPFITQPTSNRDTTNSEMTPLPSFQTLSLATENDLQKPSISSYALKTPVSANKPPVFEHDKLSSTKKAHHFITTPSPANTNRMPLPTTSQDYPQTPNVNSCKYTPSAIFGGPWSSASKSVHFPDTTPTSIPSKSPHTFASHSAFKNLDSIPLTYSAVKTPPVKNVVSPLPFKTPSDQTNTPTSSHTFGETPPSSELAAFFQSRSASLSSPLFSMQQKRKKYRTVGTPDINTNPKATSASDKAQLPEGILPELIAEIPFSEQYGFEETVEIDLSYRPCRVPLPYAVQVYTVDEDGPYRPVKAKLEKDPDANDTALVNIISECEPFEECQLEEENYVDGQYEDEYGKTSGSEDCLLLFWAAPEELSTLSTASLLLTVTDDTGQEHEVPIQLQFTPTKPVITVSACDSPADTDTTETTLKFDAGQSLAEQQVVISNETQGDAPIFFNVFLGDSASDMFSLEDMSGNSGDCIPVLLPGGSSYFLNVLFEMRPEVTLRSAYYGHALIRFASFSRASPGQDKDLHQFYDHVINMEAYNMGFEHGGNLQSLQIRNSAERLRKSEQHSCENSSLAGNKCDSPLHSGKKVGKKYGGRFNTPAKEIHHGKGRSATVDDDDDEAKESQKMRPLSVYVPPGSIEPLPQDVDSSHLLCEFRLSGSPRWIRNKPVDEEDIEDEAENEQGKHLDALSENLKSRNEIEVDTYNGKSYALSETPEDAQQSELAREDKDRSSHVHERQNEVAEDIIYEQSQVADDSCIDELSVSRSMQNEVRDEDVAESILRRAGPFQPDDDRSEQVSKLLNTSLHKPSSDSELRQKQFTSTQRSVVNIVPSDVLAKTNKSGESSFDSSFPSNTEVGEERRLTDSQKFFISLLGNDGKMKVDKRQEFYNRQDGKQVGHKEPSPPADDMSSANESIDAQHGKEAQLKGNTKTSSRSGEQTYLSDIQKISLADEKIEREDLNESIAQPSTAHDLSFLFSPSVSKANHSKEKRGSRSSVGQRKTPAVRALSENLTGTPTIDVKSEARLPRSPSSPSDSTASKLNSLQSSVKSSSSKLGAKSTSGVLLGSTRMIRSFREIVSSSKSGNSAHKDSKPRIKISRQIANRGLRIGSSAGSAVFSFMNSWSEMLEVEVSIKKKRPTNASAHVTNEYMLLKPGQKTKVVIERKSADEGDLVVSLKCSSTSDPQISRNYRFPLRIEAARNRVAAAHGFTIDRPTLSFYNSQGTSRVCPVRVLNATQTTVPYRAWFAEYDDSPESSHSITAFEILGKSEGTAKAKECFTIPVHFTGSDNRKFFRCKLMISMNNSTDFIPIFAYAGGADVQFEPAANKQIRATNYGYRHGFVLITGPEYFSEETISHKAVLKPGESREFELPYGTGSQIFSGDEVARSRMKQSQEIGASDKSDTNNEEESIFLGYFEGEESARKSEDLYWKQDDRHSLYYAGRLLDINVKRYAFRLESDGSAKLCEQKSNKEACWHASIDSSRHVHIENLDVNEALQYEAEGTEPSSGVIPPLCDAKLVGYGDVVRITARGRVIDLSGIGRNRE